MRILPCGTTALLVELADLDEVLRLYDALSAQPPDGVVDIVPAARTVLLVTDPAVSSLASVAEAVRQVEPRPGRRESAELVEVPVTYDGEDLASTADLLGCDPAELVRRHTSPTWTVAFAGFSPGFGYLSSPDWAGEVPRRATPRTRVPAGSVGLAAGFSGIYPRQSPGGWQLIGRTSLALFDPAREPAVLLRPGVRVRFVDTEHR